ncbi:hypothetical protein [Dactylosporangium sp. NPDC050588]|uniref:hypothetical protein n=1 Tax=Dactylosporangium sp. NPDC050588 TaxID=3157211 RepID=UPI00340FBED4
MIGSDSSLPQDAVVAYYRGLLEEGGWTVATDDLAVLLCADRRFDGQRVRFTLHGSSDSPRYELEVVFRPDRRDLGCT